jgi:hypothetical protein
MASRLLRTPLENQNVKQNRIARDYAFFFARSPFSASAKRDLYRFAVFSVSVALRIALSNAENVGDASFSAAATSPELSAVRSRRIAERTRVRFI